MTIHGFPFREVACNATTTLFPHDCHSCHRRGTPLIIILSRP